MSDEYNDENSLFILDNCREEGLTIQRHAFTTPFAYEINFNDNYESIWAMTSYNDFVKLVANEVEASLDLYLSAI